MEERSEGEPEQVVLENALAKARAVATTGGPNELVLGVDTIVVVERRTFGKPREEREAREFLEFLSGRSHHVWSGIAVIDGGNERTAVASTEVTFRVLDEGLLDWYLSSGEWRERAGGYAIQGTGAALVERIAGDYWNVVGLPVPALLSLAPELLRA